MDFEDQPMTNFLSILALSDSSHFFSISDSSPTRLQKAISSLHGAALLSRDSPSPDLEQISQTLSSLPLPEPVTLHQTLHSANTQAIHSRIGNAKPSILHVHSPTDKPSFPHLAISAESYLKVPSHTEAANLIASSLRDAVSANEPVTLIVMHLDATNALLPALPVAHALADRFNARVHAAGPGCLAAFRDVHLAAHSVGCDLGGALGVRGCGYLTFGVEGSNGCDEQDLLPTAVSAKYLLHRWPPESVGNVLSEVVGVVEGLSDALYRVERLWRLDTLAEGEGRIRYAGDGAKEVEEAVVAGDETSLLELSDGIGVSAISALKRHLTPPENAVRVICESLIRTAGEYELAQLARAAFIARLRQCEHVEVQPGTGAVLCVLSVVPLGQVPPAGRWRSDEDAKAIVTNCTMKFINENRAEGEEVTVTMSSDGWNGTDPEEGAVVYPTSSGKVVDMTAKGTGNANLAEELDGLAEQVIFDEAGARMWGVLAADDMIRRVGRVIDGLGVTHDGNADEEVEESKLGPDGTVELVHDLGLWKGERTHTEGQGEVAKSAGGNNVEVAEDMIADNSRVNKENQRRPEEETAKPDQHEELQKFPASQARAEAAIQNGNTQQRSKPGFWGLIFGENNSETESVEGSEDDGAEGNQLEDDYFRV